MDKRKQLRIINDLLDQCGDCPFKLVGGSPDKVHGHCELYHRIRAEGKKLGAGQRVYKPKVKLDLTVPEYWKLHNSGTTDEDIAFAKEVSPQQLSNWKNNHGVRTKRTRQVVNLSVDEYKRMRKQGMTVRKIRRDAGATQSVFRRWRQENGLLGD